MEFYVHSQLSGLASPRPTPVEVQAQLLPDYCDLIPGHFTVLLCILSDLYVYMSQRNLCHFMELVGAVLGSFLATDSRLYSFKRALQQLFPYIVLESGHLVLNVKLKPCDPSRT